MQQDLYQCQRVTLLIAQLLVIITVLHDQQYTAIKLHCSNASQFKKV